MVRIILPCLLLVTLCGLVTSVPASSTQRTRVRPKQAQPSPSPVDTLNLPSNATSIRADITDNFSCENRTYGYYADVENECQIFHVCLPVTYADGKERTFRWSFICPEETQFNQENFTCARPEDSINCEESESYYGLNDNIGKEPTDEPASTESPSNSNEAQPAEETTPTPSRRVLIRGG